MEGDDAVKRNSSELLADSESHQQTHEGDSEDASWPLIGALRCPIEAETRLYKLVSLPEGFCVCLVQKVMTLPSVLSSSCSLVSLLMGWICASFCTLSSNQPFGLRDALLLTYLNMHDTLFQAELEV